MQYDGLPELPLDVSKCFFGCFNVYLYFNSACVDFELFLHNIMNMRLLYINLI